MTQVKTISEDTARELGHFTEEEIQRAKTRSDGYIMTVAGVRYYLNIELHDFETGKRTVEMPDMMGDGRNRKGPASPPRQ